MHSDGGWKRSIAFRSVNTGETAWKPKSDADLQSALIPQELNPAFAPDKDSPWQAVIPIRYRRDIESESILYKLKTYSRVVACVVLAISAFIEIVVYLIELYSM
ncbi:unnamed protein product [Euphydryas editha]|uniref:Uncharacterized protein n=1 Tax=Euphydryas editha TaxID=104508 RepID=A0AAU9UL69_EUPED|nr:unnamed protein product [Euphydryas editha]